MAKIVKKGESPRKESAELKKKRAYKQHKERLKKMEDAGTLDNFLDGNSRGRDIALRAKANKQALAKETPPHNLQQLKDGCKAYFNSIINAKKEVITKDGEIREVSADLPMTIEGLICHLGITMYWLNKYETDENLANYHSVIESARLTITQNILEGGLVGKFNPKLTSFYLQNISKLREKPDASLDTGIKNLTFITVTSKEELLAIDKPDEDVVDAEVIEDE